MALIVSRTAETVASVGWPDPLPVYALTVPLAIKARFILPMLLFPIDRATVDPGSGNTGGVVMATIGEEAVILEILRLG